MSFEIRREQKIKREREKSISPPPPPCTTTTTASYIYIASQWIYMYRQLLKGERIQSELYPILCYASLPKKKKSENKYQTELNYMRSGPYVGGIKTATAVRRSPHLRFFLIAPEWMGVYICYVSLSITVDKIGISPFLFLLGAHTQKFPGIEGAAIISSIIY